jgi:hypothetical protein
VHGLLHRGRGGHLEGDERPYGDGGYAADDEGHLYVLWVLCERLEVEDILPLLDDLCGAWRPA